MTRCSPRPSPVAVAQRDDRREPVGLAVLPEVESSLLAARRHLRKIGRRHNRGRRKLANAVGMNCLDASRSWWRRS